MTRQSITADRLTVAVGLSDRQVDHYIRRGYIPLANPTPGSGHRRTFSFQEALRTAILAELVRAGLHPAAAAVIADSTTHATPEFTHGSTRIRTDVRAIETRLREALTQWT